MVYYQQSGQVHGKTAKRHTSADFIDFLSEVVQQARRAKEIHIVLDNLSAHKTKAVDEFLAAHPKVQVPLTSPTLEQRRTSGGNALGRIGS